MADAAVSKVTRSVSEGRFHAGSPDSLADASGYFLTAESTSGSVAHGQPIVVCSVGDGRTQEGEFYEAVAESVRSHLPVLFVIENNRYSISTSTAGKTFFDLPQHVGRCQRPTDIADEFFGLQIHHVDGADLDALEVELSRLVKQVRTTRGPALVVVHVERLSDHTNADDESSYRAPHDIATGRATADPIRLLEDRLLRDGVSAATLRTIREQVIADVGQAASDVATLARAWAVSSVPPRSGERGYINAPRLPVDVKPPFPAAMVSRTEYLGNASLPRLTMRESLNATLRHQLRTDARVILVGEDIEDPKGDVFGVTRGLSTEFPGRVLNSALSESTIVGTSIGRALAGQQPVAFIQFADFLPPAFNQIMSELASMFWGPVWNYVSGGIC